MKTELNVNILQDMGTISFLFRGSISKVMGSDSVAISASYDASIRLWDIKKKQSSAKLVGPHKEAIMDFDWRNSLLVSGDKSGVISIWDLNA